jgi:hypothetical protein
VGVTAWLRQLAARGPVPVFATGGPAAGRVRRRLRISPAVRVCDSPRHAVVLVVVEPVPGPLLGVVSGVHDQLAHPRATVAWPAEVSVDEGVAAIVAVFRELISGQKPSEAALLPDVDPVPWHGVGPYGQGGKGMTGGTPYGRPMTGRAPDRDGLELDQLPVTIGPYLPPLPVGLLVRVKLQGDVIQEATVGANPYSEDPAIDVDPIFLRALAESVPVAQLELARARHLLGWLGDALRVQGLTALGQRALALATDLRTTDGPVVERLLSAVRRCGVLMWSLTDADDLGSEATSGVGLGPVARAAGHQEDARLLEPAYGELGFRAVIGAGGGTRSRWRQRMAEITQAMDLAALAGERQTRSREMVEGPRGPLVEGAAFPSAAALGLVPMLVAGLEWGDALAALVGLDLDVGEAAARVRTPARA